MDDSSLSCNIKYYSSSINYPISYIKLESLCIKNFLDRRTFGRDTEAMLLSRAGSMSVPIAVGLGFRSLLPRIIGVVDVQYCTVSVYLQYCTAFFYQALVKWSVLQGLAIELYRYSISQWNTVVNEIILS